MGREFFEYLEKRLPPYGDPKYAGFREYILQSVNRGEEIIASIAPHVTLKNKKILDVGCGDGGVAVAFAKAGCLVTAIDNNPDNTAMANLRAKEANVSLNIFQYNAEEMDFPKASFDGALLVDFLEYTLQPKRVLRQLSRLIKPGGFCYIAVLNRLYWFNKTIRHSKHKHFYFYWELCRLLKDNGFTPTFLDPEPWRRPFRSYWKIVAIKN